MFIVTVKNIDVDSFALPTLYGKTTLQKYNFSMNPQVHKENSLGSSRLRKACHPCLSAHVIPAWKRAWHGIYGQKACKFYALRSRPFSCPFLLTGKDQRVKADIMGPPHKAGAPPPCRPRPARPTRTRLGIPTQKTFL